MEHTTHNIIETAAKRGAEIASTARPLDTGAFASAATRGGQFVDPELATETGLPIGTSGLYFPGDLPGDDSKVLE